MASEFESRLTPLFLSHLPFWLHFCPIIMKNTKISLKKTPTYKNESLPGFEEIKHVTNNGSRKWPTKAKTGSATRQMYMKKPKTSFDLQDFTLTNYKEKPSTSKSCQGPVICWQPKCVCLNYQSKHWIWGRDTLGKEGRLQDTPRSRPTVGKSVADLFWSLTQITWAESSRNLKTPQQNRKE